MPGLVFAYTIKQWCDVDMSHSNSWRYFQFSSEFKLGQKMGQQIQDPFCYEEQNQKIKKLSLVVVTYQT